MNWGHKVWGIMQSSDSHNWLLLVSSYIIVYFLFTMLKWSCFQKWCRFLRCFKEWELREPCIMYYHVLSCIIHVLSCHVAVDPTRSQSGFVCFTSGRKIQAVAYGSERFGTSTPRVCHKQRGQLVMASIADQHWGSLNQHWDSLVLVFSRFFSRCWNPKLWIFRCWS